MSEEYENEIRQSEGRKKERIILTMTQKMHSDS